MAMEEYDAVIIGAGFGGISSLISLRKLNLKIKVFEKGEQMGGIWYWNCYPGARVDSDTPIYQFFDKELCEGWTFKERYPGGQELREYFQYLDDKLDLKKDIQFHTACTGAKFDEQQNQWVIDLNNETKVRARWFILSLGFTGKPYIPPYRGIDKFKGEIHHTSAWPQAGLDLKDKRIAVIGTGASGVQTIQESALEAKQLTVFQRTPNFALPMKQKPNDLEELARQKKDGDLESIFDHCLTTFAGFTFEFMVKNTFDDSPEERKKVFEDLLITQGGFRYWLGAYSDMLFDAKANREAYDFWRDYIHSRVNDPRKAEILAPAEPPHPWGTKRPSLEQNYFELYNLPHVDIINIHEDPIEEITENGVRTKNGFKEFDVIALATGFDTNTGPMAQLDIRDTKGATVADHWKDGLKTAIGISLAGFPNMFFLYGPQAPTAFANGPTCVQMQATWIKKLLGELIKKGITRFEAKPEKEVEYTNLTHQIWYSSLFPKAKSWYQGSNIPGKKEEPLNFAGGFPLYTKTLYDSLENNYQDWIAA